MEEDSRVGPKISGYLEKKGKLKMMSSYKRYWFVLEGRLLLYYRSKDEYGAISPCKGSINLGPPCNVKPCPALPGVFQIETRTSTITLRAANREDQNRWMQGIMSALNQNKNSTRLGHFRYSLDELSQITNKEKLQSKNSLPLSTSASKDRSSEEIIQRLQKIGAQSYGGSVGTINQIVNSKKSEDINYSNLTASLQHSPVDAFRNSVLIDNDQYEFVKRNTESDNVELRGKLQPVENIYERLSGDSIPSKNQNEEVNYSAPTKKTKEEIPVTQLQKFQASCDDKILRSLVEDKNNGVENLGDRSTFLLSNDIYGISKTITNHKNKENMTRESFILENDNYCSVDKISRYSNDVQEIYAEPKCTEFTDHNENNLILSKSKDCTKSEENAYLITKLNESEKNVKFDDSSIYEDLDKYGEYTEPKYQITENIYAESVEKGDTKNKKEKKKKFRKESIENEKKEMKLKKTSSFIKRMWKKKCKHKETEEDIDELYEAVPASVVEKVSITDDTAVQMLSELHNILEHKKPILKERLSTDASSNKDASDQVKDKKPTTSNVNINNSLSRNETAVQMLWELQNILENKKGVLTEQQSSERNLPMDSASPENNIVKNEIESKITTNVNVDNAPTGTGSGLKFYRKFNFKLPHFGLFKFRRNSSDGTTKNSENKFKFSLPRRSKK